MDLGGYGDDPPIAVWNAKRVTKFPHVNGPKGIAMLCYRGV